MTSKRFGFTLIEILIAMSILGIMAALITGNYLITQKRARDARRKSDLHNIQNGLEQYYANCNFAYPTPLANNTFSSLTCLSPSLALMPTVPVDPLTISPYPCTSCSDSQYQLCSTLEVETPQTYCLTNAQ
ncbi:hypothetical protein A3C23_03490 [Candidatus Roizmanbacteria bacterium RIFCSPHIGHO2_02_FULL_37_13b]|uniref:Type II secretion system protein GspG C-terminal domain-containing protein n=1 Tax=Candidatus Roizmanbacteria bacterium RIFCSPLOWO2_02_FULL_36_11 TaxID=1802071 RepID=A0A1F7JC14_9BACT|nr:MAG: hypothetical protein A3C23_03490 [Candidatus Roizmanbacteria bacterium RIFCSPHIGHO2_02_FULL_37_13b]OGK53150.1 MAG: hypothetical protein A3H78_02085 [Candidatus Roizmanbacteria bacterium RIFCSPLOWO2_02_FULL_36_11]